MADRAGGTRAELCGVRVTGLSRGVDGNSARAMGSCILAWHERDARVSSHHSAASFSYRAAANDERFCFAIQRHFDRLRDFGMGASDRVSRIGKRIRAIPAARSRRVVVLPGDEFADGAPCAET